MPPDDAVVRLDGLSKRFAGGIAAVTELHLSVRRGQVFGLLGPNGSGKTTTLRMLLGLIHPTSGNAYLFGQRVAPGHPILRRVGAIIEGPAFVPFLTGRQNLEFFWRAGGDDLKAAHLEEALAIGDLGPAIDRRVSTYSKGMQQRLALAQAILNRPQLLILDEPTVGLDPEEVRNTRQLIRAAVERGATVLLSSHNLAEVEQVCSHAAVIDRGRLVACGTVSELLGAATSVYLEVDDAERAGAILRGIAGVSDVTSDGNGVSVQLDGVERETLVADLTRQGVGVRTITSRRRLEDVFLQLLGEKAE